MALKRLRPMRSAASWMTCLAACCWDSANLRNSLLPTPMRRISRTTASGHAAIWTSPDGLAWSRVPDAAAFRGGESGGGRSRITATGVAARPGVVVVLGMLYLDPPEVRAWASNSGQEWSKASVNNAVVGQVFSVAAASL